MKGNILRKHVSNDEVVHRLKELVGLPIGMNVEPVDENLDLASTRVSIEPGRKASAATFKKPMNWVWILSY